MSYALWAMRYGLWAYENRKGQSSEQRYLIAHGP